MYKRIIPSVLLKNGNAVKGKQFNSWRQACDVISYTKTLSHKMADEINIINLDRNISQTTTSIIKLISENISCPLSYGGGIRDEADIKKLNKLSIDRYILGSLSYSAEDRNKLTRIFDLVGNAALSSSIDLFEENGNFYRLDHDLNDFHKINVPDYINYQIELGFSEVIITSINGDGLMKNIENCFHDFLTKINCKNKLVIAGGIGKPSDIVEWLEIDSVVAVMIGSALIYSRFTISDFHNEGLRKGLRLRSL
tara:strand:- start:298 stop:1056 length:759 start_codon:yes stop_codon:yes gene_type:complete